jgi:hypothetical protein
MTLAALAGLEGLNPDGTKREYGLDDARVEWWIELLRR